MKNDSSAQMQNQALDLELFSKNQDTAMGLLDKCTLRMGLAESLALRTALSIDENDIPEEVIIPMGIALQSFLQDIVSKIEEAQVLTEVDMNITCQSIRGIMLCVRETLANMNMNKSHISNIFFLVDESMKLFAADVDALNEEVHDAKKRVLAAYKTASNQRIKQAANEPRNAA